MLRKKVLRGDMTKYKCCQGYYNCCCFRGGEMGEKDCPDLCLCLEAFCCQNLSLSASRMHVMDEKNLQSDPCDRRIIRINNCVQCLACVCQIIACITGQCQGMADLLTHCAHLMYCTVQACMTAQVNYEMDNEGKAVGGPAQQTMQ